LEAGPRDRADEDQRSFTESLQVHGLNRIEQIIIVAILGLGIFLVGWFELECILEH